jgi:opacity protein-like surface antigen
LNGENIMKKIIGIAALALALAAPAASFAQANQPVTRAQVREQIVQLEQAGYNPNVVNDAKYPADIQAAQARVDAQNGAAQGAYGGMSDGASQAGVRGVVLQPQVTPTYSHH